MKTNFLKSIFFVALSAALFTSCVADDDYGIPTLECIDQDVTVTKTIAQIKTQATATATEYTADDIIEARIVSSDKGGNFYKLMYLNSIPVEGATDTIGFSVAVNQADLFTDYGVGRKVFIKLKGLYTQIRNNTLQIGALYNGNVGQIATLDYREFILRSCDVVGEETLVNDTYTLADVNDSNLGKLIEFNKVQFVDAALGQNYYNPANVLGGETNHLITDATGATLIFRTGSFAEYAGTPVSSKSGKIRGILTKFGSTYQFVARYSTDIKLTEDRIGGEPVEPEPEPEPVGTLLFAGGDFEDYAAFLASVNSFGLKPYATESTGNGIDASKALRINGTPTGNDYVFTVKAPSGLPANATKITFWVKGTSGKSLSLNVYRSTTGYDVFNVDVLGTTAITLNKSTEINSSGNGTNQYTGAIDTSNQWVKITLNIADVSINTTAGGDIFALKVGKEVAYDLYLDNFEIE